MANKSVFLGVVLAALSAACGGGGGSAPPTPSSPAAPTVNTAPVAVIATPDGVSADEGRPISLDASNSSDADGDPIAYSWTQTGGPPVELSSTGSPVIEVRLPEVTSDQSVEMELSVSDGTNTTTSSITIQVLNIDLTPSFQFLGPTVSELDGLNKPQSAFRIPPISFSDPFFGLAGMEESSSGGLSLFRYRNFSTTPPLPSKEMIELDDVDFTEGFPFEAKSLRGNASIEYAIALEANDEVRLFRTTDTFGVPFEPYLSLSKNAPCALSGAFNGVVAFDLIVGSRGSGLSLFANNANDLNTPLDQRGLSFDERIIENTGEFCHLANANLNELFAFNAVTSEIDYWTLSGGSLDYIYEKQTPFDLHVPAGLDVIDLEVEGRFSGAGDFLIALLVSDQQHDGDHKLILLYRDFATSELVRKEYGWTKGVPSYVSIGDISGSTNSDLSIDGILIGLKTAPFVGFIKQTGDIFTSSAVPEFDELRFAPVPFGTRELSMTLSDDFSGLIAVLSLPAAGKVIVNHIIFP